MIRDLMHEAFDAALIITVLIVVLGLHGWVANGTAIAVIVIRGLEVIPWRKRT